MARVSLTVDIPEQFLVTHDSIDHPDTPGYFNSKNENSYSFTRNGSQYIASPSSPASPMMTPVLPYKENMETKRISEYEFPTAVKVDSLYQSYLNHPFNQQIKNNDAKTSPRLQKPQAYINNSDNNNKYSNYTKSSKNIRLITIADASKDTKLDKMGMTTMDLGSPTSLVSPPPPYIHPSGHGGEFDDSKEKSTTTTTVARPKLARVLPPQAIPIVTTGSSPTFGPSSADAKLLSALPTMAMGRLIERSETETLYNLQMAEDASSSSPRSAARGPMVSVMGAPMQASFPSFWEDARQQKMHWVFLSFGCVLLGSAIWVIAMQAFVEWVMVMPAATVVLCALQFGRYRWRKNRFNKQRKLQESGRDNQFAETAAALAQRAQGGRGEMAFLEPHQPISYEEAHQHHVSFKQPSHVDSILQHPTITGPTTGGFNQQSYKQSRQQQPKKQMSPKMPMTVNPALYRPSANHGQFLSPVDSPQTPPPAYFLKKIELPEINSVGDLVSEFEIDFSSIKY
ncbi:hypothetical protein CPC16_002903 [Podila verticillata]|nr:hypothetical protein BGZ59_004655 [Podila verticillata]KAF9392922.1 hypothetical protein CPC16_002903 [Podila verticillata]KFH70055.1 hypothetical protein MVEG_04858 [Podila verticillata NRRL 6337]